MGSKRQRQREAAPGLGRAEHRLLSQVEDTVGTDQAGYCTVDPDKLLGWDTASMHTDPDLQDTEAYHHFGMKEVGST